MSPDRFLPASRRTQTRVLIFPPRRDDAANPKMEKEYAISIRKKPCPAGGAGQGK